MMLKPSGAFYFWHRGQLQLVKPSCSQNWRQMVRQLADACDEVQVTVVEPRVFLTGTRHGQPFKQILASENFVSSSLPYIVACAELGMEP